MGLFGRKKEKTKPGVTDISGEQLYELLKKAVSLAIEDVETHCYTTGPEIMFEYNDNIHFIGIKYDKKRAKAEKRVTFSYDLMTVYLDKESFRSPEDLYEQAFLEGKKLLDIWNGIIVAPEYKKLL